MIGSDAAELLAQKIREIEAIGQADWAEKSQKKEKAKAQKLAKTKVKDAKALLNNTDISDKEKASQLWARLQAEHKEAGSLISEAATCRAGIDDCEQEKATTRAELNRALVIKGKLDSLFEKLQAQNKVFIDKRKNFTENERIRRQDLADQFQNTVFDTKKRMHQQANEREILTRENEDLRARFKQFFQHYDMREKELLGQQQTREAEVQVLELRLNEQAKVCRPEFAREEAAMRENEELISTDQMLREQLQTYSSKFPQFEGHLSKSDKVLGQWKRQQNTMQRKVETLTKDNSQLSTRNERRVRTATKELEDQMRTKDEAQEKCKRLQSELQQLRDQMQKIQ